MKKLMNLIAAITAAACNATVGTPIVDCEVPCMEAADCLGNQTCERGLCTTETVCDVPGTVDGIECEPGAFQGCSADGSAQICDDTGTAISRSECAFGCNATAARCNECVPENARCAGNEVEACGADGLIASTESCDLGCTNATAASDARCKHIVPVWAPTACDAPAQDAALSISQPTVIDTNDDATCNGGVIAQSNGLGICLIRYRTIDLASNVTVIGRRAPAFVADDTLSVRGILDVGAKGRINGPGGGLRVSGFGPTSGGGGGGAGFKQVGATGGAIIEDNLVGPDVVVANGAAGGGVFDPLTSPLFEGGASAGTPTCQFGNACTSGGGGGGAVLVVSCSGTVEVTGTITSGGGGGGGGVDRLKAIGSTSIAAGAGGGSGGYIVIQGAGVLIPGGRVLANGGGGGGGCTQDNCVGLPGEDGANGGRGGLGSGTFAGTGGRGGNVSTPPTIVAGAERPGGGGGSTGRFQIYTPAGVTPTVASGAIEPPAEPNLTVSTR